jgi:hypothetical protein
MTTTEAQFGGDPQIVPQPTAYGLWCTNRGSVEVSQGRGCSLVDPSLFRHAPHAAREVCISEECDEVLGNYHSDFVLWASVVRTDGG